MGASRSQNEEDGSGFKIPTGKPYRKRPLGRCSIRMVLKEISINTRHLVDSSQDRGYRRVLVNVTLNLRVYKPRI